MRHRRLIFKVGLLLTAISAGSAWAVDNTTNTIDGVVTNGGANFIFPDPGGRSNVLLIINAGVLTNGQGQLGSGIGDNFNQAFVNGSGSVWSNSSTLYVGNNGNSNTLMVTDHGSVFATDLWIANTGSGNELLVTATGQVNSTTMIVGRFFGNGSVLTVTNGGQVSVASTLYVGAEGAPATNNLMRVTGPGSQVTAGILNVGRTGSSNQMVISQGGVVVNGSGGIGPNGAFNNTALVTDSGSVWSNTSLTIGANNGFNNVLTVASSGTVYATSIEIAPNINSHGNKLIITNGGRVFNSGFLFLNNAVGTTASNNWIIVTGTGSILTNGSILVLGRTSADNHMEIRQGGVVINTLGSIGANDAGASNNTVLVTDSGSVWSNTSSLVIGGNAGAKNTLTVANTGTVYAASVTMGAALNSYGNQLIVTNGGRFYNGSFIFLGESAQPAASNNLLRVTGTGSLMTNGTVVVGRGSAHNQMIVDDGGRLLSSGISRIGIEAAASNNQVIVTGSGSLWSNVSSIVVGSGGSGNRLVVTNNGTVFATDVSMGESTGAGNSILVHGDGVLIVSGGITLAPNGTPGASNNLLSIKGAGSTVTAGGLSVGAGAAGNQMIIEDGGSLSSAGVVRIGNQAPASNNLVIVTGSGSVWSNTSSIVAGNAGNQNRLVVTDGGVVVAPFLIAGESSGTGNSILVQNGGLVETTLLQVPVAGNSISNIGGIYQFTTPTPGITAGRVFITNGTVSFRAINNAPTAPLANLTYEGNNTLRLNNATNANPVSYKFDSVAYTGNPGNYQRLVLQNNSRWVSDYLTNGVGGAIQGGAGDVVQITREFRIERSSNPNAEFNLASSEVTFTGGGGHTNYITGRDFGHNGTLGYPDGFTAENFSYGTLSLSPSDTVCFLSGDNTATSNALYVTWLDLDSTNQVANLHSPTTINIYYLYGNPDNAYLGNNVYQLTDCDGGMGGLLMPAVPEPSTLLLFSLAACAMLWRRKRTTE